MKEQEYREQAERLALVPKKVQSAVIAWLRDIASNPKLRKQDREEARKRANALERFLRAKKRK
jgi:hypothetical protein